MLNDYLTTKQLATKHGMAPNTVLNRAKTLRFVPTLVAGRWLWSMDQVEKLVLKPRRGRPRKSIEQQHVPGGDAALNSELA